jgi:hypothetical protein
VNACIQLARAGYVQEIVVILRTVIECTTHIEFVLLAADSAGALTPGPQQEYVKKYFEDFARGAGAIEKQPRVSQKNVHTTIGDWLDERSKEIGIELSGSSAERMRRIYDTNSNYVHSRYPEVMDMYGGRPGRFHVEGMAGTPKDVENLQMIDAYTTTVVQSVGRVGRHFGASSAGA